MAALPSRRGLIAGGTAWLAARPAFARPALAQSAIARSGYDPLAPGPLADAGAQHYDLVVHDASRQRDIPVLVTTHARRTRQPVVLFSHGLGGSRTNNAYLTRHWLPRGYVTVFLQHPGSDEAVWRGIPPAERLAALRRAATPAQLLDRMRDVAAVLDALAAWSARDHPLAGHLDLARIGMSGHSFGALTTQAVAGQRLPLAAPGTWPDPRLRAALAFSPSAPRQGAAADSFARVAIPWMLMTGTHDAAPFGPDPRRLSVFPALPPGHKYELVLDGAEHSAFGDRALPGDRRPRNPNHHRAILALGTAFWDSTLKDDPAAQAWLDGEGPRTVLAPQDRWQRK